MKRQIPEEYRGTSTLDQRAQATLEERRNAIVGTLNSDGTVHMAPVWFLHEEGSFYFETNGATRKARNVAERTTLTMLIQGSGVDVIAMGHGRVIGGERGQDINRRLRAKYLTEEGQGPLGRFYEALDDVAVELKPVTVVSWTADKFFESWAELPEYTPEAFEEWFKPYDG